MWRIGRHVPYSQNFIDNPKLISKLLKESGISSSDTVIEIGAGNGNITKPLSKICKKVLAVEIDYYLYRNLVLNIAGITNVLCINTDILDFEFPSYSYKVFSNIPFNYTSRIINKLFLSDRPPEAAYLIMQKEAAEKFAGIPRESQLSLFLKPFFTIKIIETLNKRNFKPVPGVKIVFVKIEKLKLPTVSPELYWAYRDFIVYATSKWKPAIKCSLKKVFTYKQIKHLSKDLDFNLNAAPMDIHCNKWLSLFNYFWLKVAENKKLFVFGSYNKQLSAQKKLKKVFKIRL